MQLRQKQWLVHLFRSTRLTVLPDQGIFWTLLVVARVARVRDPPGPFAALSLTRYIFFQFCDVNPQRSGKLRWGRKKLAQVVFVREVESYSCASCSNPVVKTGVYHNIPPAIPLVYWVSSSDEGFPTWQKKNIPNISTPVAACLEKRVKKDFPDNTAVNSMHAVYKHARLLSDFVFILFYGRCMTCSSYCII